MAHLLRLIAPKNGLELVNHEASVCLAHYDVGQIVALNSQEDADRFIATGLAVPIESPIEPAVDSVDSPTKEI